MKTYCDRCEEALAILGVVNDAAMTQRLAQNLAAHGRSDLKKPAGVLAFSSQRRTRKARLDLKGALKGFRKTPAFWC